jgi:hypothetical protein
MAGGCDAGQENISLKPRKKEGKYIVDGACGHG